MALPRRQPKYVRQAKRHLTRQARTATTKARSEDAPAAWYRLDRAGRLAAGQKLPRGEG